MDSVNYPITFTGLEFGTFRLKTDCSEADMLAAAKEMEEHFLNKQEGFLGHAILKGNEGTYVDLAFATSQKRAEEICNLWMQNPYALKFLEFLDPTSTNISFWKRLQ